jgi:ubiquinone/menaquinone biosynthesis C-methylase UbiE
VGVEEEVIEQFWNAHPCGDWQVGGLKETYRGDYERFFTDYDSFRYEHEDHIPRCLDRLDIDGKQVLEVGIGEGAEAEQLIRRGARYSAIDLTAAAVERTTTRLTLRELPHERIVQASVLDIPFPDNYFDVVFSHGVLHHVPDVVQAQREIARVLRPSGELVAMVYARRSLNYLVAIGGVRRLAVVCAYPLRSRIRSGILAGHLRNAQREGLRKYLQMKNFAHANTDGPDNPYSKVYDLARVREDFPDFEVAETWRAFMHAPPLPVHSLPGASVLGWHLWVRLHPKNG